MKVFKIWYDNYVTTLNVDRWSEYELTVVLQILISHNIVKVVETNSLKN